MLYEIIFTQGSVLLLLILITIYFHNKSFSTARNKAYKGLLIITFLLCIFESAYVYSIKYIEIDTLSYVLYKISVISHFIWWMLYFIYYVATASKRDSNSIKEVIKSSKIVLIIMILTFALSVVYVFIEFTGMSMETLDFLHGGSKYYYIGFAIIMNLLLLYQMMKNKDKTTSLERFSYYFGILVIIAMFVAQYFFPNLSFIAYGYTLLVFVLYFCAENPDIKNSIETNDIKNDIEKINKTKSDFLSNMTYEIKTPVILISSLCDELINMPTFDQKLFKEEIEQIVIAGKSLLDIINNILDICKIESGSPALTEKDYKVTDLITAIANLTKSKVGAKQVKLSFNIDQNISSVLNGDYSKLYQILINVMSNAARFTEVGKISFTLASTKKENQEILQFKIADTGVGIPDEEQSKVFDKSVKTNNISDSEVEGSGFGLSIAKQCVDALGGRIWFESKYRVGTTFYIEIPQKIVNATSIATAMQQEAAAKAQAQVAAQQVQVQQPVPQSTPAQPAVAPQAVSSPQPAPAPTPAPAAAPATPAEKLDCTGQTVLIVDDNQLNIKVAKRLLELYKFTVESVTTGKDCVYKVKEGAEYDGIFMDHMMPEMDGIETLHVLRKLDGYDLPPIIVLTANAVDGMREMYLNEGFDDYLSKPINMQELDRVINQFFKK